MRKIERTVNSYIPISDGYNERISRNISMEIIDGEDRSYNTRVFRITSETGSTELTYYEMEDLLEMYEWIKK